MLSSTYRVKNYADINNWDLPTIQNSLMTRRLITLKWKHKKEDQKINARYKHKSEDPATMYVCSYNYEITTAQSLPLTGLGAKSSHN